MDIYIFVHFRGATPFLFDDYIRENIFNKGYKERRYPICGIYYDTSTRKLYYNKTPFFGGFSMILLSRFSLFLKIIVKSKWKCSV